MFTLLLFRRRFETKVMCNCIYDFRHICFVRTRQIVGPWFVREVVNISLGTIIPGIIPPSFEYNSCTRKKEKRRYNGSYRCKEIHVIEKPSGSVTERSIRVNYAFGIEYRVL